MFKSSIRKMTSFAFSMNHFGNFFHFGIIFSNFWDGNKEKAPKHQTR